MNYHTRDAEWTAKEGENGMIIEGYFVRYNDRTNLFGDLWEQIDHGAINLDADCDVRCLYNHNTDTVLGRTTNNTLELRSDNVGLWGRVQLNPDDPEAVAIYHRIKRGDISQCSFGFEILEEDWTREAYGDLCTIRALKLYEVSPVTFPAYASTSVEARMAQRDQHWKRRKERILNAINH